MNYGWGNDDQKCDMFKIAKRMVKANQDIISEQCIRKDNDALTVNEEYEKIAWKST